MADTSSTDRVPTDQTTPTTRAEAQDADRS
jgi:hypothetical protein